MSDQIEMAKEALAGVFRTLAAEPIVGGAAGAEVYKNCEDWALHFLTAGAAPGVVEQAGATEPQWAQARLAVRSLRKHEHSQIKERDRVLTGLVSDMVAGLRETSAHFGRSADTIEHSLGRVQGLLGVADIQSLETEFASVAQTLRQEVKAQRAALQHQISEMNQRVQAAESARAHAEADAVELRRSLVEMRQAMEETRQRMQLDPLTKVYNRGAFDEALTNYVEFAHASDQPLALVLFDLDHFKKVNDTHGHINGDRVLKAFADLLARSFLRADDFVARYGGEEFAALIFVNKEDVIQKLLGSMLERWRALRLSALGPQWRLTCSAGYAVLAAGEGQDSLLSRADKALYGAKNAGRDRFLPAR